MVDIADIQSLALAANAVTNVTLVQPYADNATIGTTAEGINNTNADSVFPVIAGADIDIVSADTADDGAPAGTGAQIVAVTYLDDNFNQLTGGGVHAVIDAGSRDSGNCAWMIPAGHTGYIHGFWGDVLPVAAGAGVCELILQIAYAGFSGVANSETWRDIAKITIVECDDDVVSATGGNAGNLGSFSFPGNVPFVVPAKTMVRLAGRAGVASAMNCGFSMSVQGSGSGTTITDS